jgi:hypothetical protein
MSESNSVENPCRQSEGIVLAPHQVVVKSRPLIKNEGESDHTRTENSHSTEVLHFECYGHGAPHAIVVV